MPKGWGRGCKRAGKVLTKGPVKFRKRAGEVIAKEPARCRKSARQGSQKRRSGAAKVPGKY